MMKNIKAIAYKEFLHIVRDRRTIMLIVMMPFIQLMIYGYAINMDVKHLATIVHDEDRTYLSRRLIDAFQSSGYFDVVKTVDSHRELYRSLDRGKVKAGLLIPPDFTRDVLSGRGAKLQLLIDGTDSTPANVAMNSSQAIVSNFMQKEDLIPIKALPIDFRPRLWYNPDLKSSFFMVPGLIGFLLQMIIPMITATAIVREKERGNIEQLLVTPIKSYELMFGKLVPYIGIGLMIAVTIILAARFMFHIPIRGNPLTLLGLTFLFLTVCLGIGLLASTVADNQQQATQMIMFFIAPSILLSGFIFPRETMPHFVYLLGYFIPLTYFVIIVRGIILKGLGLFDLWDQVIPLALLSILILGMSIRRFHKRLS
ncbi:MAG: ABC transporter permease [Candidatus Omnitrophica bacterium]|nr:ABC transporter permease [Candidatus Omnitrophota bacterium]